MSFAGNYDQASPGETDAYAINMAPRLATGDTIASVAASLSVVSGADPSAASWLLGPAVVAGNIVAQKIGGALPGGLQPGVTYMLVFTVTTASGRVLVNSGHISCVAPA